MQDNNKKQYTLTEKDKTTKEHVIEKQIKKLYQILGFEVYGIQSKLGCKGGVSDLLCVKDGTILFIEVKSPSAYLKKNHNLSEGQIIFLSNAKGFVATIADGVLYTEKITAEMLK